MQIQLHMMIYDKQFLGIVCHISSCGAGSAWAAEEYAKGNSYVRTNRTGGY